MGEEAQLAFCAVSPSWFGVFFGENGQAPWKGMARALEAVFFFVSAQVFP